MRSVRLLIADDDPVSCFKLEFLLSEAGFDVTSVPGGVAALDILLGEGAPPIAILDVVMPGLSGVEVCRRIRQEHQEIPTYIILLTIKDNKGDIVEGLKAGANDYVVKPFDQAELMARVCVGAQSWDLQRKLRDRVLELEDALSRLRHLQGLLKKDMHIYEFGNLRLEAGERRLLKNGSVIPLTAKVFDLLLLLVQNSGHLLEKEEIMREVWAGSEVEDNNLTVSMSVLRRALGGREDGQEYIETVPKKGYRFSGDVRRIN